MTESIAKKMAETAKSFKLRKDFRFTEEQKKELKENFEQFSELEEKKVKDKKGNI